MGQPYVGEIRMWGGNFAPVGWMFCNGQTLPISENEVLFNLIGTSYGGDGESTFNLPDLRGRFPMHKGNGFILAETGGVEEVTLTAQQIPTHTHPFLATLNLADETTSAGNTLAQATAGKLFFELTPTVAMSAQSITPVGGSQPHENMHPFLCISFIISLFGIYPN